MKILPYSDARRWLAAWLLLGISAAHLAYANNLDQRHPGAQAFAADIADRHSLEATTVLALLDQAKRRQDILDAISRPAEAKPWHQYRPIFVTDKRIQDGIAFWQQHADLLRSVQQRYQVPTEIIVAIIGVETNYGRITGRYRVLDALATLAFHYPPRADFFRSELEQYFILGREERLPLDQLKGSYAGAMGLGQFISSSYRSYAVDFDADGQRDLWGSKADAIASVANYFKRHGWRAGEAIASPADVAKDAQVLESSGLRPRHSVAQLRQWGYHPTEAVGDEQLATLIELATVDDTEHWLGYHNFYVITRYNHSSLYAMAVFQLSREIARRMERASGP